MKPFNKWGIFYVPNCIAAIKPGCVALFRVLFFIQQWQSAFINAFVIKCNHYHACMNTMPGSFLLNLLAYNIFYYLLQGYQTKGIGCILPVIFRFSVFSSASGLE